MNVHPIESVMRTAMENLKSMVDVQTIVGDPVTTTDGTVIVPISKVQFGFAAGGSDWGGDSASNHRSQANRFASPGDVTETSGKDAAVPWPFGGGSGGGVAITPVAFLVVGTQGVRVVPLEASSRTIDRIVELVPQMINKLQNSSKHAAPSTMTSEPMPPMPTNPPPLSF